MKWILFISVFLYSCGGEVHLANPDGLWYQNDGGIEISFHEITEAYIRTQECTGLTARVPYVKSEKESANGDVGYYDPEKNLVIIRRPESYILEHEFIHHLLYKNTEDSDSCHNSELFTKCSGATFKMC